MAVSRDGVTLVSSLASNSRRSPRALEVERSRRPCSSEQNDRRRCAEVDADPEGRADWLSILKMQRTRLSKCSDMAVTVCFRVWTGTLPNDRKFDTLVPNKPRNLYKNGVWRRFFMQSALFCSVSETNNNHEYYNNNIVTVFMAAAIARVFFYPINTWNRANQLLSLRSSKSTWSASPPAGCYSLHPQSTFIIVTRSLVPKKNFWHLRCAVTEAY